MAKLLGRQVTKERNRQNVITFLGQFYGFATEVTFLAVFLFTLAGNKDNNELKGIAIVMKFMEFGCLSLVEVLTSERLRKDMFNDFNTIMSLFTNCFNC